MIFKVEKRRFRKDGELQTTRCYYLRYRFSDMPVGATISRRLRGHGIITFKA